MEQENACRWQHQNIMALNRPTKARSICKHRESAKSTSIQKNIQSKIAVYGRLAKMIEWGWPNASRTEKKLVFNEKENEKNRIDTIRRYRCSMFGRHAIYCMQVNACMCCSDRVSFHTYCQCLSGVCIVNEINRYTMGCRCFFHRAWVLLLFYFNISLFWTGVAVCKLMQPIFQCINHTSDYCKISRKLNVLLF